MCYFFQGIFFKNLNNKIIGLFVCFQNLAHLMCEMREVNKAQQFEVDDLKQKLADARGDIKVIPKHTFHLNLYCSRVKKSSCSRNTNLKKF